MKRSKVIILGAGPVGLVSAWKLLENGRDVEIYEKIDMVGGMCRSWKWGDFIVDVGPHIFHTPDQKLANFWETEFPGFFVKGDFFCKNVKGANFDENYDYPLSIEGISRFPKEVREKVAREISSRTPEMKARARNYLEYMDAQVGPTLRSLFFEKYPQKIWGLDVSKLTADWAPKRIQLREKITPFYLNEWSAVGKRGTGSVYEEIADRIRKMGGKIHYRKAVSGLKTEGKMITGVHFDDGTQVEVAPQDLVISSLPITLTAKFLGYSSKLEFRHIRIAYLAYNKPRVLPDGVNWLYYDSEKVLFNRVTEGKTMSPDLAPPGKTYLTFEVPYSFGDAVDRMTDDDFLSRIQADAQTAGLMSKGDSYDSLSLKVPFVYPLQYAGFQEEAIRTKAVLNGYPQLYSLGTGGDFNYADSQILFHMAFDTVANICGKDASFSQVIRDVVPVRPNEIVNIGEVKVGGDNPAFIIAEAGLNHNGSLAIAKTLVEEAKRAGCSAVKFQTFAKGGRVSSKVKSANYAEKSDGLQESIPEMFDRLAMPMDDQRELFKYARELGILAFSTPFDLESVDFLESVGVGLYKIASMDLVNTPLLRKVARTGKPMILSTGMSKISQIEEAIETVTKEGNPNIILLHCNSTYPAAEEEMNLRVIESLKKTFRVPVGLSDHTIRLFVSHMAITLGANMIERHFTISRSMEGPDHILSSEPEEMTALVDMAKRIPKILGDGVKRIQPNEYIALNTQRKCLYAARDIAEGQTISQQDVVVKGPAGGILPKYLEVVVGRKARARIERDYPIHWDDI